MPRKILMVAFHFPPVAQSSGVHRTLKFAQHLRDYDWEPIILTANTRAYEWCDTETTHDLTGIIVNHAFALDTARHLSFMGKYPGKLSQPDRWMSWRYHATHVGKKLIQQYSPDIIWSTYPIATAHLIGHALHKSSGIPWIADFRDTMTDPDYPRDENLKRIYQEIENKVIHSCQHAVFTVEESKQMYADRYPDVPDNKLSVISNGYDEELFNEVESEIKSIDYSSDHSKKIHLIHSGLLYQDERNPEPFFKAISAMKKYGNISAENLKITLRASGNESCYSKVIKEMEIDDIIFLEPSVPYKEALKEMLYADGLLIFQAENCNHQIPAKTYEYFRAQKPILGILSTSGSTARLLQSAGIDSISDIRSSDDIQKGLNNFINSIKTQSATIAAPEFTKKFSRQNTSQQFANLLDKF